MCFLLIAYNLPKKGIYKRLSKLCNCIINEFHKKLNYVSSHTPKCKSNTGMWQGTVQRKQDDTWESFSLLKNAMTLKVPISKVLVPTSAPTLWVRGIPNSAPQLELQAPRPRGALKRHTAPHSELSFPPKGTGLRARDNTHQCFTASGE